MPTEKRKVKDHRRAPTKPASRYSFWGHRQKARRAEEDKNYYVDRYEPRYFFLISMILALCVLDAYFTLKILELGGKELNLLMLIFIYKNPIIAMVAKYLCTAFGIIFILVHKNFIIFRRIKVYYFIYMVFTLYFILVMYEAIVFYKHISVLTFR